ncbi:uncharacterized protein LOC127849623 isoform X2 [Dreissena polymorpha]|uniref:uncharacterized protein LOC127849623 isoform X2 n=1 Tax=Dreissena polymorpha TaxID=45954 RepID=UPI0022649054|nr:uncharacterized protein LOC127849623 isoform X2 [Dreissena polymorpha]
MEKLTLSAIDRAKFIKVNNPDIEKSNLLKRLAEEVLKEYPHPEKKRLLLSITESDGKLSDVEKKPFKDSLKKILPGTCLVTGGTNTGITKLVGKCVRGYNKTVRGKTDTCLAIGIIILGHKQNTDLFMEQKRFGIDNDGTIFLADIRGKRWTFNPAILPKYCITTTTNVPKCEEKNNIVTDVPWSFQFQEGDIVKIEKISSNQTTPQNLKGIMIEQTLGKIGTVITVEKNLDLQIRVCGAEWHYQPHDVTLLSPEELNRQLKEWLENHEHRQNQLVNFVMSGDANGMKDQLQKALRSQTPTRVGIDYNGDLYINDGEGKRKIIQLDEWKDVNASDVYYIKEITTKAGSSDDQRFAVGDLVQICNHSAKHKNKQNIDRRIHFDRTYRKIGMVLQVDENDLQIDVCGSVQCYKSQDVAKVSLNSLTSLLKKWFINHMPIDTKDDMVKAVDDENVDEVRKLLGRVKKDKDIFGVDTEGFLFVVDIDGKRTLNVVGGSISPPFVEGDIVMICSNKRTLKDLQNGQWRKGMGRTTGKIGTVLEVHNNIEMRIKVCGVEWWYRPQVVGLVSLERLTCKLKAMVKSDMPETDKLLNAVMSGDARRVGRELSSYLKAQVVFGLDEGVIFGIDVRGQRHNIDVAGILVNPIYEKGDLVQIGDDPTKLENLQGKLWQDEMKKTVDKVGLVEDVDTNNDLQIKGWQWKYRPYAVKKVSLDALTKQIKKWVETHMLGNENDEMRTAVMTENVTQVRKLLGSAEHNQGLFGIDEEGSLFVTDINAKRRTLIVADDSIHPTFTKDDIVQICKKPYAIATVVKDDNKDELSIKVCGVEKTFKRKDVHLVPLKRMTNELKMWFEMYKPQTLKDAMTEAIQLENASEVGELLRKSIHIKEENDQQECGIDKDGSLFIKDINGKRRTFTLTGGSISPTFFKDDIILIRSEAKEIEHNGIWKENEKQTLGKIGTIVEEPTESEMTIKVGADKFLYCRTDVTLVSIVHLTENFKEWLEDNWPQLEKKPLGQVVKYGNVKGVSDALTCDQKDRKNGVFGIDDDGEVYVTDISNERHLLNKAEHNNNDTSKRSLSMETFRFNADEISSTQQIGKDDLVRISNDQSLIVVLQDNSDDVETTKILGKFGKVLSVKDENALVIKACGLTLHCSKTSVVKVSLKRLTNRLKLWFVANWPELDDFGTAVVSKQYKKVGELLKKEFKSQDSPLRGYKRYQDTKGSERQLDRNHDRFILVDETVIKSFGSDMKFRA